LVQWRPELVSDEIPDTGALAGDFDVLVERSSRSDDDLVSNDLVLRVALEAAHDAELATALGDLLLHQGRRVVSGILGQAAARGEVPADHDWSLLADVLTAMGLMRIVNGDDVDADYLRRVIDTILLPAIHASKPAVPNPTAPQSAGKSRPQAPGRRPRR
ncbi:MAG: TetR-like C-terminal domain-containing protein, partial [Mycobacterium sp.]